MKSSNDTYEGGIFDDDEVVDIGGDSILKFMGGSIGLL